MMANRCCSGIALSADVTLHVLYLSQSPAAIDVLPYQRLLLDQVLGGSESPFAVLG